MERPLWHSLSVLLPLFALFLAAACAAQSPAPVAPGLDADAPLTDTTRGAIVGVVIDSSTGGPIAMAQVDAVGEGAESFDLTSTKGAFRLVPLAPGIYSITVTAGALRRHYPRVEVYAGKETSLDVSVDPRQHGDRTQAAEAMGRAGTLEGQLVEEVDGAPIPGVSVELNAPHLEEPRMAITNDEGRFAFHGLVEGTYKISCYYRMIDRGVVELRRSLIEVVAGQSTKLQLKMETVGQ